MINKDIMLKQLNHSFSVSGNKEGYMLRCFLQSADDYRHTNYQDLSDLEFEALKRVYRFCIQSPMVIHNESYAVTFITKSAADMVHEQAQSGIENASCVNDIFPMFHEKFCIEPEEFEEDSEENSEEDSEKGNEEDLRYEHERMEIWKMDTEEAFEKLVEKLEDWDCEFTDYEKLKLISIIIKN